MALEPITIAIPDADPVSGLWQAPARARACLALAHGAGAGMAHPAMALQTTDKMLTARFTKDGDGVIGIDAAP